MNGPRILGHLGMSVVLACVSASGTFAQTIRTYAGNETVASFCCASDPSKIALDGDGNIYVSDSLNSKVFKITRRGNITTVAGTGIQGYDGDGGNATTAKLNNPGGVSVDRFGNVFIADSANMVIRRVTPGGTITTVAGNGTKGDAGDGGSAVSAQLDVPEHVVVDGAGNLLIAEYGGNRVRRVTSNGVISTVAGTGEQGYGGDGGPAVNALLNRPGGVAMGPGGDVYVADTFNNRVRKISSAGLITTVAGNGVGDYAGDGGPATSAQLYFPESIFLDPPGNLYIADTGNHVIRKVSSGIIRRIAGDGYKDVDGEGRFAGDDGPALNASFDFPTDLVVDASKNIYVADAGNGVVRRILPADRVGTVFGGNTGSYEGDGGVATGAAVGAIDAAVDHAGNLYLADFDTWRIRKVSPDDVITAAASPGMFGYEGGGAYVRTYRPNAVAVDDAGNLYILDSYDSCAREVRADGSIKVVAGQCDANVGSGEADAVRFNLPEAIAVDRGGNVYISDTGNNVVRKVTNGVISTIAGGGQGALGDGGLATAAVLRTPMGLAVDVDGNVYVADKFNRRIREIRLDGTIRTIAGGGPDGQSGDGRLATETDIGNPVDVAVDRAGNLYIADGYSRIRKVSPDGIITTVAGTTSAGYAGDGGFATDAQLDHPTCITVDDDGNLYICDIYNRVVRKVTAAGIPSIVNLDQHGLTGSWYNPATAGQGIELEVYPDLASPGQAFLFGGWFTFDSAITGEQRWYALEGLTSLKGPVAQLGIYSGFGGDFSAPPNIYAQPQGNASIEFADCTHGSMTYAFFDGRHGKIPLTRITANTTCSATGDTNANAADFLLSGSWYDARFGGQGLVVDINPSQHVLFAAWYTYAPHSDGIWNAASERWYVMQADMATGARVLKNVRLYAAKGGIFDDATAPVAGQVGNANITFTTCSTAVLEYDFTDGDNAGKTGTLNLTRTGPAPNGCSF